LRAPPIAVSRTPRVTHLLDHVKLRQVHRRLPRAPRPARAGPLAPPLVDALRRLERERRRRLPRAPRYLLLPRIRPDQDSSSSNSSAALCVFHGGAALLEPLPLARSVDLNLERLLPAWSHPTRSPITRR